jgi:hypothetical protein
MPHRRVRQPQNAPRIHHLRITRRAARNARDGSAAPGHAAPACNADSGRRLAASPLRRSQARRACTGGGGVSREQAHRSRIRFATPAAPRCHRLSIIASDLGLRDGPARTACLRCKRSNGRSKKRRVRPVTCEFATDCRAGGRPRIRAKQESRLAAAVRIYSFELGSQVFTFGRDLREVPVIGGAGHRLSGPCPRGFAVSVRACRGCLLRRPGG